MTREVIVTAQYPRNADEVFAEAMHLEELVEAMRGIATYDGLPRGEVYQGQRITVDVTLFKLVKNKNHEMYVETLDREARVLQSREHNPSVARWDHTLSIQPSGKGCVWTDRVIIEADRGEWFTAKFAAFVYTKRHKHRGAAQLETRVRPLGKTG